MTTLVNIRCPSLSLSISREACGAQVTRPHAPAVCRTCPVGLAHARGETATHWPDGEPVEEDEHPVARVSERRVELARGPAAFSSRHRHEHKYRRVRDEPAVKGVPRRVGHRSRVTTWVHEGRELTARELAALPGVEVPAGTIESRLRTGTWSTERAIRQ